MKILYVASMGIPLRDILSGKKVEEVTHSPGFFQPWYRMALRGHQVDFVVTSNFDDYRELNVDWFTKDNLKANIYDPAVELPFWRRIPRRLSRLFRLVYHVNKALREEDYDFVICWAFFEGFVANILANWHGVPSGMRSMGTLLVPELRERGAIRTAFRHPIEFLSFKLRKNFFLMTDDGTKGDELFQAWRPSRKKYDYLFWRTGVEFKTIDDVSSKINKPAQLYLFFAARLDPWKRHDLVVETVRILHERGLPVNLYFAGAIQSDSYFQQVMKQAADAGIANYVRYLGGIPSDDLRRYAYYAVANLFMYDVSNLGNVFFETYTTGGVIIGRNDGSLDEYIDAGRNGFLIDKPEQAADIIEGLLSDQYDVDAIRQAAMQDSRQRCFSMDERFNAEVAMIEHVVKTGSTGLESDADGICRLNKVTIISS
ncbi:MAG: glycosyltransferase [Rhizobiaceae bacterium]|nr:glycosyltransferase [Rhizobiaceae bacterium]